jgi:hypothetical protein
MALLRRNMRSIQDFLDAQDRQEQLIRRQAAVQEQQNEGLRSLIPQAISGIGQIAGAYTNAQEAEMKQLLEAAKYADIGEQGGPPPDIVRLAQTQRIIPIENQENPVPQQERPVDLNRFGPVSSLKYPIEQPKAPVLDTRAAEARENELNRISSGQARPEPQRPVDVRAPFDAAKSAKTQSAVDQLFNNLEGLDYKKQLNNQMDQTDPPKPIDLAPTIENQKKLGLPDMPTERVNFMTAKRLPEEDSQRPDTSATAATPVKPPTQADQIKLASNNNYFADKETQYNLDNIKRVEFSNKYQPIKWKESPEEAAKRHVADILKNREPNPILNLLTFGQAQGKFDQYKNMAEKIALKSVRDGRKDVEQQTFNNWVKNQEVEMAQSIKSADYSLKQAQTIKTLKDKPNVLKITGDGRKDMQSATSALRQINRVEDKLRTLIGPNGPGLPSQLTPQKMEAVLLAAATNVDTSSAGGGASAGLSGGGLGLSAGGSLGASGSYSAGGMIDAKTAKDAVDTLNKTNMTEEQRGFINETLLLAQQLGKAREGGRLTDADLRFYIQNISNFDSPQKFVNSLFDRKKDIVLSYQEMYGTYAPSNPDLAASFELPSAFLTDFTWAPQTFGYTDDETFNQSLSRQRQAEQERAKAIESGFKTSERDAGQLGQRRRASLPGVVEQAGEAGKKVIDKLNPPKSEGPKRKGNF